MTDDGGNAAAQADRDQIIGLITKMPAGMVFEAAGIIISAAGKAQKIQLSTDIPILDSVLPVLNGMTDGQLGLANVEITALAIRETEIVRQNALATFAKMGKGQQVAVAKRWLAEEFAKQLTPEELVAEVAENLELTQNMNYLYLMAKTVWEVASPPLSELPSGGRASRGGPELDGIVP